MLNEYCTDEHALTFVQRHMFREARRELFGVTADKFSYHWDLNDAGFYSHAFGLIELKLKEKKMTGFVQNAPTTQHIPTHDKTLTYYKLFKSGSQNVKGHLEEYVREIQNGGSGREVKMSILNTKQMSKLIKDYNRKGFPSPDGRYAFTFVRDPLERFISGYTEIEYLRRNANYDVHNPHGVHLVESLGSKNRVKEFIKALLSSNASKKFLTNKEFYHLAPQIGTLLAATLIESSVRLFPVHIFGEGWHSLSQEFNDTVLMDVYSEMQRNPHVSSKDPFNTTKAAKNLLLSFKFNPQNVAVNAANNDDNDQTDTNSNSNPSPNSISKANLTPPPKDLPHSHKYTRAICRIYLTDYVCLGLPFPEPCIGIEDELTESLQEYASHHHHKIISSKFGIAGYIFNLPQHVSHTAKRMFANVACITATSPECVSGWMLSFSQSTTGSLEDEL